MRYPDGRREPEICNARSHQTKRGCPLTRNLSVPDYCSVPGFDADRRANPLKVLQSWGSKAGSGADLVQGGFGAWSRDGVIAHSPVG